MDVISANREGAQQRYETVADDAGLHNIRVDVYGIEPLGHVIGLCTENLRATGSLFGRQSHGD